jgi:hypothetical protein
MKVITTILAVLLLAGCASSSTQYYEAVQRAAEANSEAAKAKFNALSAIAAAGDGQAASAAVMALALTQTPTVNPVPQKSEAIQWAAILASPVTSLGMMWMQADSAKTMAKYNADVDLARVAASSADAQALYGSFVSANAITGDVATAGLNAVGNVDYTPFVDGMVTLGTAGINGAVDLGTAGFDSNVTLGTAGISGAVDLGTAGFNSNVALGTAAIKGMGDLGAAGIDGAVNLGNAGITGVVDMGTTGITGVVDMGTTGINGLVDLGTTGYETLLTLDQGNNNLYGSVITDYTAAVQEIMNNLPNVVCSTATDGVGGTSVTCQ